MDKKIIYVIGVEGRGQYATEDLNLALEDIRSQITSNDLPESVNVMIRKELVDAQEFDSLKEFSGF